LNLEFAPLAKRDISEIYAWYELQRSGLGEAFPEDLNACLGSILVYPETFVRIERDYRRARPGRFPYGILFEPEQHRVVVYAVMHTSRDPKNWRQRITRQ
jgi:plasmid stabilization system protein ParE